MLQPIERFMALTDRDGDCWRWMGRLNHAGYAAPPESGRRVCRECANERSRKYKSKRRAMALYDAIIGGAAQ